MTKYILTDWELNMYDDSDFLCSYYDEEEDAIHNHMYGSTRFAGPTCIGFNADGVSSVVIKGEALRLPTSEVVEKARKRLAVYIYDKLVLQETRRVNEPEVTDLVVGLKVRLHTEVRNQMSEEKSCDKCAGSGKWINPKRSTDVRECFTCQGSGTLRGPKLKDEKGKIKYEKLPVGLVGEVIKWGSFGTFYRNGYNRPDRYNTSVQFKSSEGKVYRATLKNLRLDRECASEEELRKRADDISRGLEFSKLHPRHAWDTRNYAAEVVKS